MKSKKTEPPCFDDDDDDFIDTEDDFYKSVGTPLKLPRFSGSGESSSGSGKAEVAETPGGKRAKKPCPDGVAIFNRAIVDKFQYDLPEPGAVYFLSHFHSDHYGGLGPRWSDRTLYCSTVTARLVVAQLGVDPKWVVPLQIDPNTEHDIGCGVSVTLLDANHCPGSAMFLFKCGGKTALHTGDFRYEPRIVPPYVTHVDLLHIDTTFCSNEYDFPPQSKVESTVVSLITRADILYVIGAYVIGKERILVKIIRELKRKIFVENERFMILKFLDLPSDVMDYFTVNPEETNVHVVSMSKLSAKKLAEMYEKEYSKKYAGVVGFSPTGWVYPECVPKRSPEKGIRPYSMRKCGKCLIYCVPYSEHSSFSELRAFVRRVNPDSIYPFECPNEARYISRLLRGEIETKGGFAHVDIGHFFSPQKNTPGGSEDSKLLNGDDSDVKLALKFAADEENEVSPEAPSCDDVIDLQRRLLKFANANKNLEQKKKLLLSTPISSKTNVKKKQRVSQPTFTQKDASLSKAQRNLFEFFN